MQGDDTAVGMPGRQRIVIVRSEGVTTAERYLKRLAERTFLSLWSYTGLFRDQKAHQTGDGKELCDLLVVFGDDVLIFSDKACEFKDTGRIDVDWRRWFKKAVAASANQVWGAERWIREYPDRIFLDRACTQQLPIALPDPTHARIHRIAVAHGAADRCREHFGGGSGSLIFKSVVVGDVELFTIGQIDPAKGFVHVLDDTTLDIIMETLDTITDFVDYLTRKERFLTRGRAVVYAGEEDLLAYYLHYTDEQGEHDFVTPDGKGRLSDYDLTFIPEGLWADFRTNPQRKAQITANEISYAWDRLIEKFNGHALAGTQYYTTKPGVEHSERIMHFLAAERRTRRRMLAEALIDVIDSTPTPARGFSKRSRIVLPSHPGDPHYVFLAFSWPVSKSEQEYRTFRMHYLQGHCLVTKLLFPDAQDIVGIATEPRAHPNEYRSEDSLYFDARLWDDDLRAEAEWLHGTAGILSNITESHTVVHEYPPIPEPDTRPGKPSLRKMKKGQRPALTHRRRNALCSCGSGKKYKNCHGG